MSEPGNIAQCASAVAAIASAYWGSLPARPFPDPLVALVPAVSPTSGVDAIPAAYAIPSDVRIDRENGHVARQTCTVVLAVAVEVAPDEAMPLVEAFRDTVEHVLSRAVPTAAETGLHIPSGDIRTPFDAELLRTHGVLYAAAEFSVVRFLDISPRPLPEPETETGQETEPEQEEEP